MNILKSLTYIKTWCTLGLFWIAIIFLVSLDPSPPDLSTVTFGDKIVHALSYFFLMFWFLQIVRVKTQTLIALVLIGMGVIIEILQGLSGYRTFDVFDMMANSVGVFIAWQFRKTRMVDVIAKFEALIAKRGLSN